MTSLRKNLPLQQCVRIGETAASEATAKESEGALAIAKLLEECHIRRRAVKEEARRLVSDQQESTGEFPLSTHSHRSDGCRTPGSSFTHRTMKSREPLSGIWPAVGTKSPTRRRGSSRPWPTTPPTTTSCWSLRAACHRRTHFWLPPSQARLGTVTTNQSDADTPVPGVLAEPVREPGGDHAAALFQRWPTDHRPFTQTSRAPASSFRWTSGTISTTAICPRPWAIRSWTRASTCYQAGPGRR